MIPRKDFSSSLPQTDDVIPDYSESGQRLTHAPILLGHACKEQYQEFKVVKELQLQLFCEPYGYNTGQTPSLGLGRKLECLLTVICQI